MPDTSSPHLAASPATEKTPYFSFIDGLRCLAVTCVLLFHILGSTLPGGYVGVDVFFVISGFLITGLCLREKFSYGVFLAGRARRILPAYFAVLLISGLAAFAILLPEDLADAHKALLASPVFLQNFVFWKQVNYFSPALERNPFLHTWSLAVEWQFYLVFPLLLRPLRNTRWLIPALVAMSLLTLAASTYGAIAKPTPTFYLTPFRVWEFLVGGFVALWLPRIAVSNASAWALGLGGGAALLLSSLCFSNATPFPGAAALVPCLGTAALLLCGLKYPDHPAIRLLTLGPVRLIGQASYSIYLVHWPLLVFVRYFEIASEPVWVSLALIAASCALGLLSWRWVERPFRNAARGTARRNWGLVTACAIAAVGATAVMTNGIRTLPRRSASRRGAQSRLRRISRMPVQ